MMGSISPGSDSDLLSAAANLDVFTARLQSLSEKTEQAKRFSEQAKAANLAAERTKKETEELSSKILAAVDKNEKLEHNISVREQDLKNASDKLAKDQSIFDRAKSEFEAMRAAFMAEMVRMKKAVADAQAKVEQEASEIAEKVRAEISRQSDALTDDFKHRKAELEAAKSNAQVAQESARKAQQAADVIANEFREKLRKIKSIAG